MCLLCFCAPSMLRLAQRYIYIFAQMLLIFVQIQLIFVQINQYLSRYSWYFPRGIFINIIISPITVSICPKLEGSRPVQRAVPRFLLVIWLWGEAMVWCRTAGGWSDVRHKSPKCSWPSWMDFIGKTFSTMIMIIGDDCLYIWRWKLLWCLTVIWNVIHLRIEIHILTM